MIVLPRAADDSTCEVLHSLQFPYIFLCGICPNVQAAVQLTETKAFIAVNNDVLSRQCLTRLICARRAIHSYTVVLMRSSNVKFESKITARSFADCTEEMSFPNKEKRNSWSFEVICRLPKTINFVLLGKRMLSNSSKTFAGNIDLTVPIWQTKSID